MISDRPRRLDGVSYVGYQRYFLTSCTAGRHQAFAEEGVATRCTDQLLRSARLHDFEIPAYCFMPDHLHVLALGDSLQADFRAFVKHFKQISGFEYKRATRRKLWQTGYDERVLRDEESTLAVARYIFENPLRAGLETEYGAYPYAGSTLYDYRQT
jgi:putative transposase